MKSLITLVLLSGCGRPMEYSPWASNPTDKNLTAKHLARLEASNTEEFEPFKFVLTGDSQAVVEHMSDVIGLVNNMKDVSFITLAGDITDRGLNKEYEFIGRAIEESVKPLLTVVGNHDGLNNSKKIYSEMFGPLNYSFIYKNIKFVMWNNNPYEWYVDLEFLSKELSSGHRTIVIAHQPPLGGSLSDDREALWSDIRDEYHNLIASLHGHTHKTSFRMEKDLPIYTVARVTGTKFGLVTVTESQVLIQDCTPICNKPNGDRQ